MRYNKQQDKQQGVSLYITMLILSILTGAVLALSSILTNQMRVIFHLGDSVVAFSAADAGVEKALYNIRRLEPAVYDNFSGILDNGAAYDVTVDAAAETTIIKSIGSYNNSKRAVEARY